MRIKLDDWTDVLKQYLPFAITFLVGLVVLGMFARAAVGQPQPLGVYEGITHRGQILICDTAEQWERVIATKKASGQAAADAKIKEIAEKEATNIGPACGHATGAFIVTDIPWEGELDGLPTLIVELAWFQETGALHPVPVYATVHNAKKVLAPDMNSAETK